MGKKNVQEMAWIIVGTTILAAGIHIFFEPNSLVAGGATGLGIVLDSYSRQYLNLPIPLWLVNISCNVPLFLLAWRSLGKKFLKRTMIASLYFSLALFYTEFLPIYKGDMVLVCVFGGVFVGVGVGLVLRGMATTGGTDLAASLLHKKYPRIPVSKAIFFMDAMIIALGLVTFGAEQAMYAVVSVYISSKCVNLILEGLAFSKAAFIISEKSEEIAEALMQEVERGVTAFSGRGMYTKTEKEILLCVFSQKEITAVKEIIMNIDRNAFLLLTDMKEVLGEGFEKV